MSLASLRQELQSRGGEAPMWLVFLDDAVAQVQGEWGSLLLQRAFWTRGEAYAYAQRLHRERAWQHFSVFKVIASADAIDSANWNAEFEMAFERETTSRVVSVSPTAVAQALGRS
jgi:hypothetical protein